MSADGRASHDRRVRPGAWTKRPCLCVAAITLAGIELAQRIRKGQYLLPIERDGRAFSLKELWARALSQAGTPAIQVRGCSPSMHQISAADRRSQMNARTTGLGEVRYPRKISFGRNLYLLVMPKGGRYWRYCYRYDGKRKTLALGTYPDVPMARARSRHQAARKLLAAAVDPSLNRRDLRSVG
jgi:hypothetical protein